MQVFTVRIEELRTRYQRVLAHSVEAAVKEAKQLLRDGDRIIGVGCTEDDAVRPADVADAHRALQHLLASPFLDLDGKPQVIADWLRKAVDPPRRADLNRYLAVAGLRVLEDGVAIASPGVPAVKTMFCTTKWAGRQLLLTLGAIPGAKRSVLTLAGIRARVVIVPHAELFQEDAA